MATVLVLSREPPERWASLVSATFVGVRSRRAALMYAVGRRPEVVLVDADTPGVDCLALLPELRGASPDTEIVVTTANPSVAFVVEAIRSGASDVLGASGARASTALSLAVGAAETRRIVSSLSAGPPVQPDLVGCSSSASEVRATLDRLCQAEPGTVLIEGETGTGKEVVASLLHERGPRSDRPWIRINCAALPASIMESELFGHARGAFTSATAESAGLVEAAEGGTLFLDEIADVPLEVQPKLLRLIEQRTYRRVGACEERRANVILVAATNADLEERVRDGRFRGDLYFRLGLVHIRLAPLRERLEDIPALAATFVAAFARRTGHRVRGVSAAALDVLARHDWPGNVRELRNVIERAFVLHPRMGELRPEHVPPFLPRAGGTTRSDPTVALPSLATAEREAIADAMLENAGNISAAARQLGLGRHALLTRVRRALAQTVGLHGGRTSRCERKM